MRISKSRASWRRAVALTVAPAVVLSVGAVGVSTPSPAQAAPAAKVPNVAKLAGQLAKQKLNWETCDFGSQALNDRFNKPNVKCATVEVPRDWHNPTNGKTWDIRISQAKNQETTSARYKGTIFANPGGPGGSGLPWGPAMQERTPDLNPYYNYVGFDPRGVGQSSIASCEFTWDPESKDPNARAKALGQQCSQNEDVKTINTEQTAYDMDFIRHLLKAPKLSYVGYSYGTWLGAWYENVFGARYGDKFVLDSSTEVTDPTLQATWELQPIARDRQFDKHMLRWIARHDAEYGLGTDAAALRERYFTATANLDPFVILLYWALLGGAGAFGNNADYPVAASVVQLLIEAGEGTDGSAQAAKNPAKATDKVLAEAEEAATGTTKAEITAARERLAPLTTLPTTEQRAAKAGIAAAEQTETTSDPFDFIRCNDGQWTQGAAYWDNYATKTAKKARLTNSWGLLTVPVCAFWRTSNTMPVADAATFPQTIVVQGELDSQTGWETGYASGTKLPNTSFIAIDNEGSHGHFPYGTEAVDRPIYDFFLKGKQPKDITVTQGLPLPAEDVTYESWAKLNKKAKHVPVEDLSPWTPTRIKASTAGDEELADITAEALIQQKVAQIWGDRGTRAFGLD